MSVVENEYEKIELRCPFCQALFQRGRIKQKRFPIQFCAYCGTQFIKNQPIDVHRLVQSSTYVYEHGHDVEKGLNIQIGRYFLMQSIGKGGMGEVFLAYDTTCGRKLALKRIRPDLVTSPILKERFIREARITSQLIHPSIIPIYDIHIDQELIYYTMPYVEGETLKALLKKMRDNLDFEENILVDSYASISSLVRVFLTVAQAVAFAHSRGVLHRDLKPENVIIGRYGQIIILDWGLTKLIDETDILESTHDYNESCPLEKRSKKHSNRGKKFSNHHLTRIGKVVGTLAYMAPERAQGKPASIQTDIYALGVILYQMLTLTLPFPRRSVQEFQEKWHEEKYIPAEIRAPHRDVPQSLSEITRKCLYKNPQERWKSVDELISHIEGYLEGRSEWTQITHLHINKSSDWAFQEHILLAEHTAISTSMEQADWYRIMLSKESFGDNVQIHASLQLDEIQHGIGFLLAVPDESTRRHIVDGYCVWLAAVGTEEKFPSKILRHGVTMVELPDIVLSRFHMNHIRIEKVDQSITVWINDEFVATHTSFFPVVGGYVGLLLKEASLLIDTISIASGSVNILVNRLAVPDAFLANLYFHLALQEYRRIASLFPGHVEGREALFRAGVCLLEQAKKAALPHLSYSSSQTSLYDSALQEFEKLRATPGAPLEYLGKALVYHALEEYREEVKCFELAFLRYKHHPLLHLVSDLVIQRMHEMSQLNRTNAYDFISLVARRLPKELILKASTQKLFKMLQKAWEVPTLFENVFPTALEDELNHTQFCLILAFWLMRSHIALDIFSSLIQKPILPKPLIYNALVVLVLSCKDDELIKVLRTWQSQLSLDEKEEFLDIFSLFTFLHTCLQSPDELPSCERVIHIAQQQKNPACLAFLLDRMNSYNKHTLTYLIFSDLFLQAKHPLVPFVPIEEDILQFVLEALFTLKKIDEIEHIFTQFLPQEAKNEHHRCFFWYGLFLAITGKKHHAMHHFRSVLDVPAPRSWLVAAHVLSGKLPLTMTKGWLQRAFPFEKEQLYRQLSVADLYASSFDETTGLLIQESLQILQKEIIESE